MRKFPSRDRDPKARRVWARNSLILAACSGDREELQGAIRLAVMAGIATSEIVALSLGASADPPIASEEVAGRAQDPS